MPNRRPSPSDPRAVLGRVPPHAEEAEKALLGAILVDPKVLPVIRPIMCADDLYVEAHRAIFEAMLGLEGKRQIDAVTLSESLRAGGKFDRIGGAAYLDQLIDAMPTVGHAEEHAAIIREKAGIRRAILGCSSVVAGAFDGWELADVHRELARVANAAAPASAEPRRGDGLRSCLDQRPEDVLFFPIYGEGEKADLGGVLGGFTPGQKLCIAGYTNNGKTGLVIALAVACAHAGLPTGYFALEDSQRDLEARTAGILAGLSPRTILDAKMGDNDRYEAKRVIAWFEARGFWTYRMIGARPEEICNAIQSAVVRRGLRVVIVDYLQAAAFTGSQSRTDQVDNLIKGIERASGDTAVAVLVSQLRRKGAGEKQAKPVLDDLRDSGAIGYLSRSVVFVNRAGDEVATNDIGRASWRVPLELDVAKNKGPMGSLPATLFRPQSFVWPGTVRPSFRWEADSPTCEPSDDVPHPAEQQAFDEQEAF